MGKHMSGSIMSFVQLELNSGFEMPGAHSDTHILA